MSDGTFRKRKPVGRHLDPYHSREESAEVDANRSEGIVEGRNAVVEALRSGRPIDKIYVARGETDAVLGHIASKARQSGAVVVEADRRKLDAMSVTKNHQGVIALASVKAYASIEDILQIASNRNEPPFIVICDEISDPHNLGAIIRTAECTGAHGVIIPKRRSAGMTAVISKTSAGAVEYIAVARVSNLTAALCELKKAGVWIYGADADGESHIWQTDLAGPAAVVIGSEGKGLSRLVLENCDFRVRIPMVGKIPSLNASVSASIIMYEALRQRSMLGK